MGGHCSPIVACIGNVTMFRLIVTWFKPQIKKTVPGSDEISNLPELERKLGYRFRDQSLLVQALKHRSYLGTSGEARHAANERMEFLGDAVLDLVVSEFIYRRDERADEGKLTQLKCSVVSGKMLAKLSEELGIGEYLLLSDGESRAGGRKRVSILEDAFEAIVGAIYLDGGLQASYGFLERVILERIDRLELLEPFGNHKSELLEWAQDAGLGAPRYLVLQEEGPEHNKLFHITVELCGHSLGVGQGKSKKQAEQNAARYALDWLQTHSFPGDTPDIAPLHS